MKKISSNIILLGVVSFLNDLSSEMIMPILPMFITSLGGSGAVVGLIGGLRDSLTSILKVLCGYWSDKTGKRKVFVFAGYLVSALFKFFMAVSTTWPHILASASLERTGKGLRSAPRDAIIADSMPKEKGKGFGIHRAMDTAGAVLGSLIVFFLFWNLDMGFKPIILISAFISFPALIPLIFVKEEKKGRRDISLAISLKGLPGELKLFTLISGIFTMANFSYMFFVLKAQDFFSGRLSVAAPILLYILFNIFHSLFAIPSGILADRIGRKRVLSSGYLLFALTSLGFAFCSSLWLFIVLFAAYGIVLSIIEVNQRAFASDLSTEEMRGTALGTFHTVTGLVSLPASLIAGLLWQHVSPASAFVYGSAVSLVSVVLLIALKTGKLGTVD
ncbi:MAG: MFS transporter [Nitrospirae bacterium]|nr:MFS transporter [Nitrospirota bacterium]